MDLKDTA